MDRTGNDVDPGCQEFEERPAGQSVEHKARAPAANFIGDKYFGTGGALRVRQLPVFALYEKTAQRNHEQDTEQATRHCEQRHLQQFRGHPPHEQRG